MGAPLPRSVLLRLLLLVASALAVPAAGLAEPPHGSITIERIADIKYPSNAAWSPDGTHVAFLWDAAGKQDLFVVAPGQTPVALTDYPVNPDTLVSNVGRFAWASPDQILFNKEGQLWSASLSAPGKPARVGTFEDAGNFTLSHDRKQIAFVRRGQIWAGSLAAKTQRQITFLRDTVSLSNLAFSPDDRWIAFEASRSGPEQQDAPFNGTWIRQFWNITRDRRLGLVSVYNSDPTWVSIVGDVSAAQWTAHGTVLYQELSADRKTRLIRVAAPGEPPRTLWKDADDKWWSPQARDSKIAVSPDGRLVVFPSDRTGWVHLYVMPTDATSESQAKALTSGNHLAGVASESWAPDSRRLAYHHGADGNHMERFIDIVDVTTGKSEPIVTARGVNFDPAFSPDGARLLYQRTAAEHSLDLYVVDARAKSTPVRVSDSMPAGLQASDLTAPVPVEFPSRVDGKPVPATLIVSKTIDKTRRNPAIVWIHGSGPDQNYLGWHPDVYRMYYSMHQYLAQQGYVILTPDYRGSSGYHHDWAVGSYMDMGGSEYLDVASGADYLKTLPYVDPDRIGVWGLSYGGFMTLQAAWKTPTLFRCLIDVAGVTDWYTFSTTNTAPMRMGTPMENPDGFYRMAPWKHMDQLVRPLMIVHGTNDTNVPFRESLQLIDALVKLGKDFEFVAYPGEVHFFRRAHVLRDTWRRAEAFFDRYLKTAAKTGSAN